MPRYRLTPLTLAAATALFAGAAMAEPAWTGRAAQGSPEDRPSLFTGAVGARSESIENAGWSANGNSARLMWNGGRNNSAGFAQIGRGNRATIVQTGNGNDARVRQRGTDKQATIIQYGDETDVQIDQHGDGDLLAAPQSFNDRALPKLAQTAE